MKEYGLPPPPQKVRSIWFTMKTISDADYSDDLAPLANTPTQAQPLLHSLEQAARSIGLHANSDKTEFMPFSQDVAFSLNGKPLKLVNQFT